MDAPHSKRRFQVGGTLDLERHIYIPRREDSEIFDTVASGEWASILTSRQVGKSSLVMSCIYRLHEIGVATAYIDLTEPGTTIEADDYYAFILGRIAKELHAGDDFPAWWEGQAAETHGARVTAFFREYLAPRRSGPVVIFLDEIDSTISLPFSGDIFMALRAMYNQRGLVPAYRGVTFCLVGVATPNELIRERRTTAYNIGRTFELQDLSSERNDLSPFYNVFRDRAAGERIVSRALYWTDGHPYLTQKLCAAMATAEQTSGASVDEAAVDAYVNEHLASLSRVVQTEIHFQQILRYLSERLSDALATLLLYERVVAGEEVRDEIKTAVLQLKLSGLVKNNGAGRLIVRNRIYARLFDRDWIRGQLHDLQPRVSARRMRALLAAAAVLIVATGGGLAYYQYYELPRQTLAEFYMAQLQTTDEEAALRAYGVLSGRTADDASGMRLSGYQERADALLSAFWGRSAAAYEDRARRLLQEGDLDRALIYGAIAGVKANRPLQPELRVAYEENGYDVLERSIRVGVNQCCDSALSPDDRLLVVNAQQGGALILDLQQKRVVKELAGPDSSGNFYDFLPEGRTLAVALDGVGCKLFQYTDLVISEIKEDLCPGIKSFSDVEFSPTTRELAVLPRKGIPRVYPTSGAKPRELKIPDAIAIAFSNDRRYLAVWTTENNVNVYDRLATKQEFTAFVDTMDFADGTFWTSELLFHPSRPVLYVAGATSAHSWDFTERSPEDFGTGATVSGMDITLDGRYLVISYYTSETLLFDTSTLSPMHKFGLLQQDTYNYPVFFGDGKHAAVVQSGVIRILDYTNILAGRTPAFEMDPLRVWAELQRRLDYTVNDDDEVVPLGDAAPRVIQGAASPELFPASGSASP